MNGLLWTSHATYLDTLESSDTAKLGKGLRGTADWPHHIMSQQAVVQLPVGSVRVMGCMGQAARPADVQYNRQQ